MIVLHPFTWKLTLLWAGDRPKMVDQMGFTSNCITPQVHTVGKQYLRVLIFMIWQWTGESLVAMRAVQQGLLVGWICHTFDVKMGYTALWLPIFDFGRHYRLDMSKYVCKTPHTIYFLNFWVHFTYVHYNQPKMVDLPNIPHTINSWQFLQGKRQHI